MMCAKTLLLAFVALSLMTVVQATQSTLSHNAAVRRHASMISQRPARRSVAVSAGRMVQKRQTAEQLKQAADLKAWDDDFHAKNAQWQQAAMAALASGQTPPSYDEYWSAKSGSSSSSSSSSPSSSDADAASNDQSSAPAQQQHQQADTSNADSGSSNNGTSDSTECEEDSADSTDGAAQPSSSGAAAAAASGSKSNATTGNGGGSSSSSSSSASTSGSFSGQATYYAPGLGACGWTNSESDYIVAVSHSLFDSFGTGNPNNNRVCGHKIKATYQGKSITVSVSDRCEGCSWGDLDFTESAFQQLAPLSKGRLDGLTWSWIGAAP